MNICPITTALVELSGRATPEGVEVFPACLRFGPTEAVMFEVVGNNLCGLSVECEGACFQILPKGSLRGLGARELWRL